MLSVIVPAYNEGLNINKAVETIGALLSDACISHEILFVDDGSRDSTWSEIQSASTKNNCVLGVRFSRNFGKESAIFAGLAAAQGECVVVIDCDLQHPPEKIIDMYRLWEKGYEVVEGVKASRGDESVAHGLAAKAFYALISRAVKIDMSRASDFKLLDRKAVNVLLRMPERNAFFRALSSWIGFKSTTVEYDVQKREIGTSKWSTASLIKYALTNISSFSALPMQIVTLLGVITLGVSTLFGAISLYQKICGRSLGGFTTVIILLGFMGSIIMISLGIIGYYIAKIYDEVKGRPRYIIAESVGDVNR